MDAELQQLGQIPGVVGTLVYGETGRLKGSHFPAPFAPALEGVAASLAQDAYLGEWLQGPTAALDMRFSDGRVVLRKLARAWLLVLCTTHVNIQLLDLALTQVLRRIDVAPQPIDPFEALRDRLKALARAELGQLAPQAVELFSRAGSLGALAEASDQVEKITRLFVSRKKAEELALTMHALLEKETHP